MESKPESSIPQRRRWFAFSLRMFLFAIAVLCVWLAWWVNSSQQQRKAVAAIRAGGGSVYYDYQLGGDRRKRGKIGFLSVPTVVVDSLGDDYFQNVSTVALATDATDEMMQSVGKLSAIQAFHTSNNTHITDVGVAELSRAKGIYQIDLISDEITDESLKVIGTFSQLDILTFDRPYGKPVRHRPITGKGLGYLQGLNKLRVLRITGSSITDDGIEQLGKLKSLQWLLLSGSLITGAGFATLPKMPAVEILDLDDSPFDDEGLVHLECFSNLKSLRLNRTKITSAGLVHLLKLQKLENLDLDGTGVTDEIWHVLGKLPKLQQLSLAGTNINGEGISELNHVPIQFLNLSDTNVDDSAISALEIGGNSYNRMATLHLQRTKVTPVKVQALQRLVSGPWDQPVHVYY